MRLTLLLWFLNVLLWLHIVTCARLFRDDTSHEPVSDLIDLCASQPLFIYFPLFFLDLFCFVQNDGMARMQVKQGKRYTCIYHLPMSL